jgi:hypothetical protein
MKFMLLFLSALSCLLSQDLSQITKILTGKSEYTVKCSRPYQLFYNANKNSFSPSEQFVIESIKNKRSKKLTHKFLSARGFEINYAVSGSDAVPLASNDSDTIPDYVQNVASYFDESFDVEVTQLGFDNPMTNQAYRVDLVELNGSSYGTTVPNGNGSTYIEMDNDYIGYGNNNDVNKPLGSAKVTAAHEFKHSIQYVQDKDLWLDFSNSWVETDATWAEELVYDHVDDYYNYLNGSQLANPLRSLHNLTSTGSYEDVIFQIAFSEQYGNQQMVNYWKDRKLNPSKTYYETFERILQNLGGFNKFASTYFLWNHFTGSRSVTNFGYPEANFYPNYQVLRSISSEGAISGDVLAMSSRSYKLDFIQNEYLLFTIAEPNANMMIAGHRNNEVIVDYDVFSKGLTQVTSTHKVNDYDSAYLIIYSPLKGNQTISYNLSTSLSPTPVINEADQQVRLAQNPVINELKLVSKSGKALSYEIFNIIGQRVKKGITSSSTFHSIPLSNIAGGLYFIRVKDRNYQEVLKFVRVK